MNKDTNKEKLYNIFLNKLKEVNVDTSVLDSKYGKLIQDAPFTGLNKDGLDYSGSLLKTVLYGITPIALEENKTMGEFEVDKNSLIKVCLLQHISKAVMFIPNPNEWEVQNRNKNYIFSSDTVALKTGLYSVALASECNIQLTPLEIEAMTIIDKDENDQQSNLFSSVLSTIVKIANMKSYVLQRETFKKENENG